MLEWTGERYLPWIKDAAIAYEHLHRYMFASRLAIGKRVLDLASGEGYGTHLLAKYAESVVGVEIDKTAVEHAREKYKRDNLEFLLGSATELSLPNGSFDMVVCFEAIEHIEEQEKLISEVRRILKPNGVFVVSTPNKHLYSDEAHADNPFHVRELEFEEFRELLHKFFTNVDFLGQRIYANSSMWPIEPANKALIEERVIARNDAEFEVVGNEQRVPLYFIAAASNAPLPDVLGSVLIDSSDELLNDKDRQIRELLETKTSNETALAWRDLQVARKDEDIADLRFQIDKLHEALAWKDDVIRDLREAIASNEEGIAWLKGVVAKLAKDQADLTERLQDANHQLELIHASRGWRFILWLRRLRKGARVDH